MLPRCALINYLRNRLYGETDNSMKIKTYTILAVMLMICMSAMSQTQENIIKAIKLEFDDTSMTIKLSHQPKVVMEDERLVIKTVTNSIILSLPCRATFVDANGAAIEDVVVFNNDETKPLCVYSLDGKKVATLKEKADVMTLRRGIYIINGKKMIVK